MAVKDRVHRDKTSGPSARRGIATAKRKGIETVRDRYQATKPRCDFGELGVCCNNCLQGPCHVNSSPARPNKGICGARDYTIVSCNLARHIGGGTAAHASHGRHIAETLLKVIDGTTTSYSIKDAAKVVAVAKRLGVYAHGLSKEELTRRILDEAMADYSRFGKQPLKFATSGVTKMRSQALHGAGLIPCSIDHAISDVMHRTSMDCDADPIPLLFGGIACAIADYDSMQISTDLSDMLFGAPHLVRTQASVGAIKANAVNIAIPTDNPVLSEVILDVAESMELEAKDAGASGINIIAVCCTGNETLKRKGAAMAANFPSQKLAVATGAVDLIVADYQCIMPSLADICACTHTEMVTTKANAHIPFDTHVHFREEEAEESARAIVRMAIEGFKKRNPSEIKIPDVKNEVIDGFSLEQICELCATLAPEDPLSFIIDGVRQGRIRGIALLAGCNSQKGEQDHSHLTIAKELLKHDVLLLATGCLAGAFAKNGFLAAEATGNYAGERLKAFLKELGEANDTILPPIWHMGSCADSTRAMNLATALAERFGTDVSGIPFAASALEVNHERAVSIATWCVALGLPVHVGTINCIHGSSLVAEVLTNTAQDVFGGRFIVEPDPSKAAHKLLNEIERRRWKLDLENTYAPEQGEALKRDELISKAIDGGIIATGCADHLLSVAIERYGYDQKVEFPETGYALPSVLAWEGKEVRTLADLPAMLDRMRGLQAHELTYQNALAAGEATMIAAEIVEALKYIPTDRPYEGTGYCGFIPDKVLRELGIAFVDDTIPGCAVLIGTANDPKKLAGIVRDCQSKGMLIIASFDTIKQLRDQDIKVGLDFMLYPVGEFTQIIHGLNFAIRAALTFGGVQRGDRERLQSYLAKRPKVFVLQFGPIDSIKAAAEFAVLLNGSPTITDQPIEPIPEKFISQPSYEGMIQTAIELRGIQVKLAPVDIPVAYGPAFEGETVRRPDTYIEAGGVAKTTAFELLRTCDEADVEDGKVTLIGPDVDQMPEGGKTPLAILVEVYGKKMQEDFESVLERRIHQFINFAEGAWHTGQRNTIWIRLSKSSVKAGLRLRHFGDILVTKMKGEFGNIVSRVQVTIITDEKTLDPLLWEALQKYRARDARMSGLTDETADVAYSCTLCQSFAADHVCIVMPERLGLCGAINWLDAKAAKEIAPTGPNQPIVKGATIDATKGQWEGVNRAVYELSHHKLERFNAYTMMEDPMTSCGCFECIVAMTADMQAVAVVSREYPGMTPVGMKFSTLAGSIGGGKQTPGFIGVGRKYLLSKKFISADGGFLRIAWMPKDMKEQMLPELKRRATELGVPDFVDKIADETVTTDAGGLAEWMAKVDHPALKLPPLLS